MPPILTSKNVPLSTNVPSYSLVGTHSDIYHRLRLGRFRGIDDLTLSFPGFGVILLDGRSGIGKTTLLEAISFVLYGGTKNSCYPRTDRNNKGKKGPTWAELTLSNDLIIYRQRRPNLFWIKGKDISLTDDAAQGYIDDMFGPVNIWLAGGYLRQGELCSFLSMSAAEKLNFLQGLSLPTRFEILLERVINKIVEVGKELQENTMQIKVYQEMYMNMYNNCSEEMKNIQLWDESTLNDKFKRYDLTIPNGSFLEKLQLLSVELNSERFTNKIQSQRDEINLIRTKIIRAEQARKQKETLEKHLTDIQKEFYSLTENEIDFPVKIAQIMSKIHEVEKQILVAHNYEQKSRLLAAKIEIQRRLAAIPDETSSYTSQQLDEFERILKGPTLDFIEQTLKEIENTQIYQTALNKYQQREVIRSQLETVRNQLAEYPDRSFNDEIDTLTQQIYLANLQQNKLTCPKCSGKLYLHNGQLTEIPQTDFSESPYVLQKQKMDLQEKERKYQQRGHIQLQFESLKKTLSSMDEIKVPPKTSMANLSPNQLNTTQIDLERKRTERLRLPNIDINVERRKIVNSQDREKLIRDISYIQKELSGIELNKTNDDQKEMVLDLKKKKEVYTQKLTKLQNLQTKISIEKARHDQIKGQLNDIIIEEVDESLIDELQSRLDVFIQGQQDLRHDITIQSQLYQMIIILNKYNEFSQQQTKISERINAFQKIRATLITAEYVILDTILSNLNVIIADILGILFNEPIMVTLRSLRQLKTNDRIKPEINIEICYKGAEFCSLNELSGGEKSRVSLALVIAFSRIGKCPFLLLDESLSSLDVVTKESAIVAIRRYLNNKLTITVNHDTTEGVYDSVVRLS